MTCPRVVPTIFWTASEAGNWLLRLAQPRSTGAQFADLNRDPSCQAAGGPMPTNSLANTISTFKEGTNELPPAYETVPLPQVGSSSNTTERTSGARRLRHNVNHNLRVAGSFSS
ncbi:hypothetical protein RSAG8_11893, partial [Rhizoctonia solani AG-8 WAC10335]